MEMTSLNISLPEAMKRYIEEQAERGGYSTVSEYLRELVRADQKRKDQEKLEALLLEGLESGEPVKITPEFWEAQRKRLEEYVAKKVAK